MLVRHRCICILTARMRCIFEAKNDEMKENKNPLLLQTETVYAKGGTRKAISIYISVRNSFARSARFS